MSFQVSATGSSVETAQGPQQLLNDTWPLTKLDTTKTQSFQTISILFNHEPPQPDPVTLLSRTQIYQFAHGYNYVPAIWMEWQNKAPAYPALPGPGGHSTTFFDFGDDTANENIPGFGSTTGLAVYARIQYNADPTYGTASGTAYVFAIADATNITIYMEKVAFPVTCPIFLIGTTVSIRMYAFVEPANTSTY